MPWGAPKSMDCPAPVRAAHPPTARCAADLRATGAEAVTRRSLPHQLQACLNELLSINERHHELRHQLATRTRALSAEVERSERLEAEVEVGKDRLSNTTHELQRTLDTLRSLRTAHALAVERAEAAEAENANMRRELHGYVARSAAVQSELAAARSQRGRAEIDAERHRQVG